jgi:hypothetical protein
LPLVTRKEAQIIAGGIAKKLGETKQKPRHQIMRIVMLCGAGMAQEILQEALASEKDGGMMTMDGKRRRTLGGVFFHLARNRMSDEIRQQIFYPWQVAAQKKSAYESQFPPFAWEDRLEVLANISAEKGEVATVKITLTGRPGAIERRQNLVITTMQDQISESVNLPAGVPNPSSDPMTYTVYIASKQWERVAKAIENPEDVLIVDGLCAYDAEADGMAMYSMFVTTEKMQRKEKKSAKKAEGAIKQQADPKGTKKQAPKQVKSDSQAAPKLEPVEVIIPPGTPDDVAQKLHDLHSAAATFRQKLADILAKPDDQQFGLEMTQKLLNNTEKQIEDLEKPYLDQS